MFLSENETYLIIVLFVKTFCWSMFYEIALPPNNCLYSFGKRVVMIVQIWHRDVQSGIMQSTNQIISRNRYDYNHLSAHKILNLLYHIKVRGLGWPLNGAYVMLLQPCDSSTRRVGWSIVMFDYEWMISVAKYVSTELRKVFWQCFDKIVRIHVLIEKDQTANTVVANDTITETIRLLLTLRRHSDIYFSPAVLHTLPLPSQYAKLNLHSSEKNKQDQFLVLPS